MKRGLTAAVLLDVAGAALLLFATSRSWLSFPTPAAPPLPARAVDLAGSAVAPGARALGFLGLAGVAALAATRSWGRRLVGLLLALSAVGAAAAVVRVIAGPAAAGRRADDSVAGSPELTAWPYVALLGAALLLAAGVIAAARGGRWAAMGVRYQPPVAVTASEASLWESLDRGHDPTT